MKRIACLAVASLALLVAAPVASAASPIGTTKVSCSLVWGT
jgi:hypothetical protein